MKLALDLGRPVGFAEAPLELRMLLIADELSRGRSGQAIAMLKDKSGRLDSTFLLPFLEAWGRADKKDASALTYLEKVGEQSALGRQVDEHRALILLKLKKPTEALPHAEKALAAAGGRADRLRLAYADGFRAAGDGANAAKMLDAGGAALEIGRAQLTSGRSLNQAVDTSSKAFGELLLGLSLSINRMQNKSLAIALAQVARYANPDNSAASLLLGLLLDDAKRPDDALAVLQHIDRRDPFASQGQDAEIRILLGADRKQQALQRATEIAAAFPSAESFSRLGAVQSETGEYNAAADNYGRAIALTKESGDSDDLWTLHLYRGSALEDGDRWAESKAEIAAAMALSPDNALLLNFLGYGKLERGEDMDSAEAMIRQASALRPDDASITDSLGWAEFKRGKVSEAIVTLQRASERDPTQAEIREHLGDALYSAGRKIEARFAWRAALVTVDEDKAKTRLESKLAQGLNKGNAAP